MKARTERSARQYLSVVHNHPERFSEIMYSTGLYVSVDLIITVQLLKMDCHLSITIQLLTIQLSFLSLNCIQMHHRNF